MASLANRKRNNGEPMSKKFRQFQRVLIIGDHLWKGCTGMIIGDLRRPQPFLPAMYTIRLGDSYTEGHKCMAVPECLRRI